MFEGFKRFWKGFMQMFGYTTLKQIVGKDITLSDKMIDAINEWKQMLNGQADWITDSIVSRNRRGNLSGICRLCSCGDGNEPEQRTAGQDLSEEYFKFE